jgi:hypothetical protein
MGGRWNPIKVFNPPSPNGRLHIDGAFMDGTLDWPLGSHLKWPQHLRRGKKYAIYSKHHIGRKILVKQPIFQPCRRWWNGTLKEQQSLSHLGNRELE